MVEGCSVERPCIFEFGFVQQDANPNGEDKRNPSRNVEGLVGSVYALAEDVAEGDGQGVADGDFGQIKRQLEAEPFFFAGQQAFDAQLFDTGYHQHADQHTQRSKCFGNLCERYFFCIRVFGVIFAQAPAAVCGEYGYHQADCAGNQRWEFFIDHRQCNVRKGTGEYGDTDEAQVFADFSPRYDEAQADHRDDETSKEVHYAGLHTDFHNALLIQAQRSEAEPSRGTYCTEGYGYGVHDQSEDGYF